MKRWGACALQLAYATAVLAQEPAPPEFDTELAKQGLFCLQTYCQKCHGDDLSYPGLDVADLTTLLHSKDDSEAPFIVPGKPGDSRLWDAVDTNYMPPEKQPPPSEADKAVFQQWLKACAHFPAEERAEREFLGEQNILKWIAEDFEQLADEQIPYVRYGSLARLWNDTRENNPTTDADLRILRAAVSKLVNSSSSKSPIVLPRLVDKEYGTLLGSDMRDYGWDEWHWNQVSSQYPYGLKVGSQEATRIYRVTGTNIPFIRADWFCAVASRPQLYHAMLPIPSHAKALEADLGVDIRSNFENGPLARAAFPKSSVSQQDRMVERHNTTRGGRYYWKSYDMLSSTVEEGDFIRRPLGPVFEKTTGRQLATFKHDSGEIIDSLPNGLQAFMLVNGTDFRIDQRPPKVVYNPNQHGGSFLITNGISCMGCRRNGMINLPPDDVRPIYEQQQGQVVADRVWALYPHQDTMQKLVRGDIESVMLRIREATGPYLQLAEDKGKDISEFAEPVTKVTRRYLLTVDHATAVRELGLPANRDRAKPLGLKSEEDLAVLGELQLFKELGLANWNSGGTISGEN